MTSMIEWLLNLEGIRLGRDAPLLLKWQNPIEAWVIFCAALMACTWVVVIYRRESASIGRRVVLGFTRLGLIALTVAILCQPAIVLQRDRVQHSYVAFAFDTSASMGTNETYRDVALARTISQAVGLDDLEGLNRRSRLELVQTALRRDQSAAIRALLQHNDVQVWPFSGATRMAYEVPGGFRSGDGALQFAAAMDSLKADGTSTDLAGALRSILDKSAERRLAAIVLATDGQSTQPTRLQDAIDEARNRGVPIYPLRVGSTYAPRDLSIGSAKSPASVFVNDVATIHVELKADGLTEPTECMVNLMDASTDEVLASRRVTMDPRGAADGRSVSVVIELTTKVTTVGTISLRVEVVPLVDETVLYNNTAMVHVTALDNQLRVLYVDGYPRYEYRYLKNALIREKTVDLSVLLIEADEAFVQEGTLPIRRFPHTMDELNLYDVVLFGDVDPRGGWLSASQLDMLVEWVGQRGGGFGVVAGQRAAPSRFAGTPLEKLLPVRVADQGSTGRTMWSDPTLTDSYQPVLTQQGLHSSILRFALNQEDNRETFESLPGLYWIAQTLGPKPGASVLLEHPSIRTTVGFMPIVVTARYGAGKLFFQATDDTWLWRREHGEFLHDSYWVQVVRDLARGNRAAQNRRMVIRTDRRTYPYGSSMQVQVEFLDPDLLALQGDELVVSAMRSMLASAQAEDPSALSPSPTNAAGRFAIHRISEEGNLYDGTWIPPTPGTYSLSVTQFAAPAGQIVPSVTLRVERPNLEVRHPEANHEVLQRLATQTGGKVIDLNQLTAGFEAILDRSMHVPDDIVESIWDSKLALILFVLMISIEWVLRKSFGLL